MAGRLMVVDLESRLPPQFTVETQVMCFLRRGLPLARLDFQLVGSDRQERELARLSCVVTVGDVRVPDQKAPPGTKDPKNLGKHLLTVPAASENHQQEERSRRVECMIETLQIASTHDDPECS